MRSEQIEKIIEEFGTPGGNISTKNEWGMTALHRSTEANDRRAVFRLLHSKASASSRDLAGMQPLHYAASIPVARALLRAASNANSRDKDGASPLHWAAARGNESVCAYLLKKGADISAKDKDGQTPLHWAARAGQVELYNFLVQNGATQGLRDRAGKTPLAIAPKNLFVEQMLKAGKK